MADWTDIDPDTLLPGEPWTSAKALAAFENLDAAFEGAPGAPRLNYLARGFPGPRNILSATNSGAVGLVNLGAIERVELQGTMRISGSSLNTGRLQIRYTSNNGGSWGAWQNTIQYAPGTDATVEAALNMEVSLVSGEVFAAFVPTASFSGTTTVPANCNGFQLQVSGVAPNSLCLLSKFTQGRVNPV